MLAGAGCAPAAERVRPQVRWASVLSYGAAIGISAIAVLFGLQDWAFARAGDALRQGNLEQSVARYRLVRRLPFPKPGQDLWLSRRYATMAAADASQRSQALQLASEASRRAEFQGEDPSNAHYQSAALSIGTGDIQRGEDNTRLA